MADSPVDEFTPVVIAKSPVAGFWRRLLAFLIDNIILGIPACLLGVMLFPWAVGLGQAGRLVGFCVALLYFGLLNSRLGGGHTVGKRLLHIRVIDRTGQALSPMRSVLRSMVLAVPYFLNGVWFGSSGLTGGLLSAFQSLAVFGGLGAIAYLLVFNRRTRQSLHDLAVDSFVVCDPPAPVQIALYTPRLHLMVASCWLALTLIAPKTLEWWVGYPAISQSVAQLEGAISDLGVSGVKVVVGTNSTKMAGGQTTTSTLLRVNAISGKNHDDLEALVKAIAEVVLKHQPDLMGKQNLVVHVRTGFDLGLASWTSEYAEEGDAAAWRKKLGLQPV